jgi:hypothetical protein
MMNQAPFDDHIKSKLSGYQPEVPPHIWENIMAEKDKRRPGGFIFFLKEHGLKLFIAAAVLTAGALFLLNKTNQVSNESISQVKSNRDVKNDPAASNNTSASSDIKNNTNTSNSTKDQSTLTSGSTTNNAVTDQTDNSTVTNNNPGNDKKQLSVTVSNVQSTGTNISSAGNNNRNNMINAVRTPNKPKKRTLTATDANSDGNDFVTPIKKPRKIKGRNNLIITDADAATDHANDNDLVNLNSDAVEQTLYPDILSLQTSFNRPVFNPTIRENKTKFYYNIPCPGREKNAAGNKRYIEIYAGPDYALRSFKDTANSVYLQKRKESTSFQYAFSAGLRFTKVFSNGISFRTGFNYSQVNEKFKYEQGNIIQVVYVTNAAGDTTGSYTATSTRYKTTYNKYRTLDIPLIIGFEMGNGRLHTNINAGAIINLYSWQKGDLLDKSLQPVNITTGGTKSPYQFKNNIGVGFMGAISFYYKLNDRFHLLAEPYFRYNFSPVSKSDLTLKQKYNTAGLRLGLRFDF